MKAVLKYPGAKNRLASWIIQYVPEHAVYLEPYFGSGAILFNKARSHIETVNDLNDDVVNFFRIVREQAEELSSKLMMTPYARTEYDKSYEFKESDSELERARKFCVRCWQGFGCANKYHNGFKSGQQSNSPNPAKGFGELPEIIIQASKRLKGVQIEHMPALELIERYNTADVFMYLDPPYKHNTRKGYLYKHEMDDKDHIELLNKIKNHPGKVMISGYDNELYDDILYGWEKRQHDTRAEGGVKRTETIWMNYNIGQQRLAL